MGGDAKTEIISEHLDSYGLPRMPERRVSRPYERLKNRIEKKRRRKRLVSKSKIPGMSSYLG